MKLATTKQIQELMEACDKQQATSYKQQASSNKHQAFFQDPCFNHPDVWYKIWLKGILEYLEKRQATSSKPQASSCAQPPSSPSSE